MKVTGKAIFLTLSTLVFGGACATLLQGCSGNSAPASTQNPADTPIPAIKAEPVEGDPSLADPTTDPVWTSAQWHTFTHPLNDSRPGQLTRVAMLYDNQHLYVAVMCADSHLIASGANQKLTEQDAVEIWLDTAGEQNDRGTELLAITATSSEASSVTWYRSTMGAKPKPDGTPDFSRPISKIVDKGIPGLKVHSGRGQINGKDAWGVTFAIPMHNLPMPLQAAAKPGSTWHFNAIRYDWQNAGGEPQMIVSNLSPVFIGSQQVSSYRMSPLLLDVPGNSPLAKGQ